ncbi:MAG: hypothetical protein R3B09_26525, partial [Nannocystaceae bacterium]
MDGRERPARARLRRGLAPLAGSLALVACASPMEARTRAELARIEATLAPLAGEDPASEGGLGVDGPATPPTLDGSLDAYVAHALARSPSLRSSFERWRAAS